MVVADEVEAGDNARGWQGGNKLLEP